MGDGLRESEDLEGLEALVDKANFKVLVLKGEKTTKSGIVKELKEAGYNPVKKEAPKPWLRTNPNKYLNDYITELLRDNKPDAVFVDVRDRRYAELLANTITNCSEILDRDFSLFTLDRNGAKETAEEYVSFLSNIRSCVFFEEVVLDKWERVKQIDADPRGVISDNIERLLAGYQEGILSAELGTMVEAVYVLKRAYSSVYRTRIKLTEEDQEKAKRLKALEDSLLRTYTILTNDSGTFEINDKYDARLYITAKTTNKYAIIVKSGDSYELRRVNVPADKRNIKFSAGYLLNPDKGLSTLDVVRSISERSNIQGLLLVEDESGCIEGAFQYGLKCIGECLREIE